MRRMVSALIAALMLVSLTVAGASAATPQDTSGWTHFHWVPTDIPGGFNCGVAFVSEHPTGYVDFWSGPIDSHGRQHSVQHWNGTMTFTGPLGNTVTMRENDWRYISRTYTSDDMSTFIEKTTYTGLLEKLTASDGAKALWDRGALMTKTDNVDLGGGWVQINSMKIRAAVGHLPIRRSGFDLTLGAWNSECAFFAAHLS